MANKIYAGPAENKVDVLELLAAASLLPGTVAVRSAGKAAAAGAAVAGEFFVTGTNVLGEIGTAYAADETAQLYRPKSGEYYNVRLAASQSIAAGAGLTTNASGLLVAQGANPAIVFADQAVTTTGSTGFIRVRVA